MSLPKKEKARITKTARHVIKDLRAADYVKQKANHNVQLLLPEDLYRDLKKHGVKISAFCRDALIMLLDDIKQQKAIDALPAKIKEKAIKFYNILNLADEDDSISVEKANLELQKLIFEYPEIEYMLETIDHEVA